METLRFPISLMGLAIGLEETRRDLKEFRFEARNAFISGWSLLSLGG